VYGGGSFRINKI